MTSQIRYYPGEGPKFFKRNMKEKWRYDRIWRKYEESMNNPLIHDCEVRVMKMGVGNSNQPYASVEFEK